MAEDMGEKSELPTPKKLEEARNRGQIAKSMDLVAAIDLIGAVLIIVFVGGFLARAWMEMLRRSLGAGPLSLPSGELLGLVKDATMTSVIAIVPILIVLAIVAMIAHFAQSGAIFTTHPLQPKFDKLNPINGFKNRTCPPCSTRSRRCPYSISWAVSR
jgi:flagellar biosynthesis protein FlhB